MIPMLVGSRFVRQRSKAPRRAKVWVGAFSSTWVAHPPSTSTVVTLITEGDIESQGKPTLARVRGTWAAMHDISAAGVTSAMVVAAGITVVSTKAVTAGITAVPTPLTNIEWPWLWWDSVVAGVEIDGAGVAEHVEQGNRIVDSKAMRKLPPASALIMVFETGPALEGAPDVNVALALRLLLMPS